MLNSNAELSSLSFTSASLNRAFERGVTTYSTVVPHQAQATSVTAAVYDSRSTVSAAVYDGNGTLKHGPVALTSGQASPELPLR
ncbi:cadherin-like beta sandwich domain-containing protein [Paenibacillus sp. YYML68]|uniref:cadherin-like beta sandwich domain-containing protein n=1 Tax=Paenibacillus sp. YYML68 TaxID=2909250 RepID=UPI0024926768|nr:cadherin-like beta sandwich domain-containing protein [Paenibacillus sp. YYML68]